MLLSAASYLALVNSMLANALGSRGSTCSHYSIKPFILIMTVLSALLIMAGDVELNPGPRGFRKCPQCEQVPIKCKTCTNCGLSFNARKSTEAKRTQWNKNYHQTKKLLREKKPTLSMLKSLKLPVS